MVPLELSSSWIERYHASDSHWISDRNCELYGWFFHICDCALLFVCTMGGSGWDYALQAAFGICFGGANEGDEQW
jgi:hypothetical protein